MAKKYVTRTVKTTVISAVILHYDKATGDSSSEPVSLTVHDMNVKDSSAAFKLLSKEYGNKPFAAIEIEETEKVMGIPMTLFYEHAVEITRAPSQTKKED